MSAASIPLHGFLLHTTFQCNDKKYDPDWSNHINKGTLPSTQSLANTGEKRDSESSKMLHRYITYKDVNPPQAF